MIKLTDTRGVNSLISSVDLRFVDVKPNKDDNAVSVIFHYNDSVEVTVNINAVDESKLYDQLDRELSRNYGERITLRTAYKTEYVVSLVDIKYVWFGDIETKEGSILRGTKTVKIYRFGEKEPDEFTGVDLEDCKQLKERLDESCKGW